MKNTSQLIMNIASEVSDHSGVQLGEKQKDMIINRLRRRMYSLGLASEEEYVQHYIDNRSDEFKHLLSLFTTHHTFFFREFKQFEVLRDDVLPRLVKNIRNRSDKTLRIWSAACSRGQEVYSLAVFLTPILKELAPDIKLEICGTDIDEISVEFASNAVFLKKEVDGIPLVYQTGNFIRGSAGLEDFVKVHSKVRENCWFKHANLIEPRSWPDGKFDIIFCRNVFIYFSPQDISRVVGLMKERMHSDGALFLGLTESINGISSLLKAVGPSVYAAEHIKESKNQTMSPAATAKVVDLKRSQPADVKVLPKSTQQSELRRVLCVDDSPTVLDLMKGIFNPGTGYIVAATANNGKEAADWLKKEKFDLITLDIHMPEMTGLEFMQKEYRSGMPPVLVVSSVERTEKSLALEMMRLGAKDYIQKPSLKDFNQYKEEIHLKAKTMVGTSTTKVVEAKNTLDREFASDENKKLSKGSIAIFFKEEDAERVKRFIFSNKSIGVVFKLVCVMPDESKDLVRTYFSEYSSCISEVHRQSNKRNSLHLPSMDVGVVLSKFKNDQLNLFSLIDSTVFLAEEAYPEERRQLAEIFDLFPSASLGYMVKKTLLEKKK